MTQIYKLSVNLNLAKLSAFFLVNSFLCELIVNRILIVSVLLSFHLYLVDYFIKDILLFESNYFIIIMIHVHTVHRADIEAQFGSKLGSTLWSDWLQQVIMAIKGLAYSLIKNIENEEK